MIKDNINRINKTLAKAKRTVSAVSYTHLMNYWSTMMIDCFHECHFLTTACTICHGGRDRGGQGGHGPSNNLVGGAYCIWPPNILHWNLKF